MVAPFRPASRRPSTGWNTPAEFVNHGIQNPVERSASVLVRLAAVRHHVPQVFGGELMSTDHASPRAQGDVAESVCDARLTLCRLLNEVQAAFGEMDELLGR